MRRRGGGGGGGGNSVGTDVGQSVGAAVGQMPVGYSAGAAVGDKVAPGGSGVGAMPWLKRHCTKLHLPASQWRQTTLSDHMVKLLKKIEKRTNCAKNAQVLSHKTKTTTARCRRTKNMRAMNMLLTHLLTSLLTY